MDLRWIIGKDREETLDYALDRTTNNLGTNKFWGPTRSWSTGIFSRDSNTNPHFYNWNSVYINYCDGTGHEGYRKDPIVYKGKNIYIRGLNNTLGFFD